MAEWENAYIKDGNVGIGFYDDFERETFGKEEKWIFVEENTGPDGYVYAVDIENLSSGQVWGISGDSDDDVNFYRLVGGDWSLDTHIEDPNGNLDDIYSAKIFETPDNVWALTGDTGSDIMVFMENSDNLWEFVHEETDAVEGYLERLDALHTSTGDNWIMTGDQYDDVEWFQLPENGDLSFIQEIDNPFGNLDDIDAVDMEIAGSQLWAAAGDCGADMMFFKCVNGVWEENTELADSMEGYIRDISFVVTSTGENWVFAGDTYDDVGWFKLESGTWGKS